MIRLPGPALSPLEAAARLGGRPGRFLLHSGSDVDGVGRWSFVGAEPAQVVRGGTFDEVAALASAGPAADAGPGPDADPDPFPRAVGFIGYDAARRIETLPIIARDDVGAPDLWFGRYDAVWRHDATTGRAEVVGVDEASARALRRALDGAPAPARPMQLGPVHPDEPPFIYMNRVSRILEYIRAGDAYQVNLARRLTARVERPGDALELYARLTSASPAPYGGILETPDLTLVSASPELFLRSDGRDVETRPIKGTRRRGEADALASDPKEAAEHLMIVDLLRNDLGRVATTGSVRVEDFARVVTLPQVHHLVSTVRARLREDAGVAALLGATFPGGSITGAPKVRAMEIIEELEPTRRGPYTGALGWIGAGGALDLAIIIRTAIVTADRLMLHVGGGIVADSSPARELEETEEKALGWSRVLGGV